MSFASAIELLDFIDDLAIVFDDNMQVKYGNKAAQKFLGIQEDGISGLSIAAFIEQYAPSAHLEEIQQAIIETQRISLIVQGETDTLHFQLHTKILSRGKELVYVCLFKPKHSTSGKALRLQSTKEQMIAQMENTTDAIWAIDAAFRLVTQNTVAREKYGEIFKRHLNIGDHATDSLPADAAEIWSHRYKLALEGIPHTKTDHYAVDGVLLYTETSFSPIRIEGEVAGVSCFSRDVTLQREYETALMESERKFKHLVSNIPSVAYICRLDEAFSMEYISDEITNVSGYAASDFIDNQRRTYRSIIHPEDLPFVVETIDQHLKQEKGFSLDYRILHQDGSIRWVNERGRALFDDQGHCFKFQGVITDNTMRVRDQQMLQTSEDNFRKVFQQSNTAIAISDGMRVLLANQAWEELTGYDEDGFKNMDPMDFVHPEELHKAQELMRRLAESKGEPVSDLLHIVDARQQDKWMNVNLSSIEFDGDWATMIILTDFTEQVLANREINKMSAIIMNSPTSIVITDKAGVIEYVNPFFQKVTGYSADEAMGKNPSILKSGGTPPEVYVNLWQTISAGNIWEGEFENKKKDGQKYWELARIAPIMNERDEIVNYIAVKQDITERKIYQQQLEENEQNLKELNAKKDKFFSIIAHDLRSPFVGLVGLTDLLHAHFKEMDEEKIIYYLKHANESAHNVYKLLETLLQWSKTQTGKMEFKPEPIDLRDLIHESLELATVSAKNKNISLINYVFNPLLLEADKNMLFTVLRNLISNAIKYTPRDGKVEIDCIDKGQKVQLSVRDYGVGIPLKDQAKLFKIEESYSNPGTEKEKGSGLGLLMCKEFIEKHGGKIWCKSEENAGSTFFFTVPKSQQGS